MKPTAPVLLVLSAAATLPACEHLTSPPPPAPIVINTTVSTPAPKDVVAREAPDGRAPYIRSHYTKFEYRLPMRDGAHLFTSVYVPSDASPKKTYPILLSRTPYSVAPYGADRYAGDLGPTAAFEKAGYIFVQQDVRGRFMSEGSFVDVRPQLADPRAGTDESTDTFDTIAWLLAHVSHHNGKVGQWGVSYPGLYTSLGALSRHPALVAVSPQAPVADWWHGDDWHRNGAFNLQNAFTFYRSFGLPRPAPVAHEGDAAWRPLNAGTPDQYRFFLDLGPMSEIDTKALGGDIPFWRDLVEHPDYDDFWKARDVRPRLRDIKAAVLVVGGWFDTEDLFGALETYQAIEAQSPSTRSTLIMGPWRHGGWNWVPGDQLGDASFGFATTAVYQDLVFAFFEQHLKGAAAPDLPEALVFESGANRWRRFDHWPPREIRPQTLYLRAGGGLGFEPPANGGADAFDEFVSDPARPVPNTMEHSTSEWAANYMTEDQRAFSRRPDVLVYETAPLERDVTLAGPLDVELFVSTTGTDADWVVKLVDANPGRLPGLDEDEAGHGKLKSGERNRGAQETLVRGEPFRGRYREGGDRPKAFTPGEVTKVAFRVDDVLHTFQRGHRIQIQIQSSWFPFIDRNPQTFIPNIFAAKRADFVKANHRVYLSPGKQSAIKVRVLLSLDDVK
jgi:uncharacterized protein